MMQQHFLGLNNPKKQGKIKIKIKNEIVFILPVFNCVIISVIGIPDGGKTTYAAPSHYHSGDIKAN